MAEVQTLFIKFTDIKGTAKVKGYTDYIPINNLSFNTYANITPNDSGVLASSGVQIDDIRFEKADDFNSDEILNSKMLSNESFKEVVIVKATTNKNKIIENRKITLTNVCVSSATTNMSDSGSAVNTYTLAVSSFKRESQTVAKDGQAQKIGPKGYDFVTAEAQ
ncbi:type VI secretion system tube protein Hcp [Yersinia enterocolitica]|uniref:type VI secretion system tube protein Hcp n=1 Tax=Yersinia enterocolitica TaxID=630 RepID=UPI00398CA863